MVTNSSPPENSDFGSYVIVRPDVAGGLGNRTILDPSKHPPQITFLHYEFEDWGGDAIVESFPCFLITAKLGRQLQEQLVSGFQIADVQVSQSKVFTDLHPCLQLPEFKWLKVCGVAGQHDFGISSRHELVINGEIARELITSNLLPNATIKIWQGP